MRPARNDRRRSARPWRAWRGRIGRVSLLGGLAAAGCGRSGDPPPPPPPPPPPAAVSLVAPGELSVEESDNPTVAVTVRLDRTAIAAAGVTVGLEYSGSAIRGHDYAAGADAVTVPAGAASASTFVDIYRDFDAEGDETIAVGLGAITGDARPGAGVSFTLTVLDGEAAALEPTAPEVAGQEPDAVLIPFGYAMTEASVVLAVGALNFSPGGEAVPLVAEWSTDFDFLSDVHRLGTVDIPAADPDPFLALFPDVHEFVLPLERLAPHGRYFIRAYLGAPPVADPDAWNVFVEGFATDAGGHVLTRCEAPSRTPGAPGTDPLFAEQWHLVNTGQTGYSDRGGAPGEDLRMTSAIAAGRGGSGVTLAVVDSGLEICHPDLAANAGGGGSYNFAHESFFGAAPADPFNPSTLGDPELTLLRSLGGSDAEPDSASVDVFNMSFGVEEPPANESGDIVRLFEMGTSELRGGRGAVYVKAAGNGFGLCDSLHPLSAEIGCISANSDPMQNLPYVIAVGAFNAHGAKSSYSSAGANLWVVGPGGEDGVDAPAMITADQAGTGAGFGLFGGNGLSETHPLNRDGDYLGVFGGTSSAAPAVAGAAAVLLGVNPELTWRDVKHILAASARWIDPERAAVRAAFNGHPYFFQHAWQANAAGYRFHNGYGFGAVDVDAAVALAMSHAPDSLGEFVESDWFGTHEALSLPIPDGDGAGVSATMEVGGLPDGANIEAVILEISVEHADALQLGVALRSPAGTPSVVNPPFNAILEGYPGLHEWRLLSNAFYGERPNGTWTVHVADLAAGTSGHLGSWRLRFFYGTHP